MTEKPPEGEPTNGGRKPLVVSPTALILALAELGALVYNVHLDAQSRGYNGLWVTGILAALVAGTLGFDLKFPGRGDSR